MKDDAKPRVERAKLCGDARTAVQTHFDKVGQKVQGERDDALKTYVKTLVEHYRGEKTRHATPIQQVQQARAKCEQITRTSY